MYRKLYENTNIVQIINNTLNKNPQLLLVMGCFQTMLDESNMFENIVFCYCAVFREGLLRDPL